MLVRAMTWMSSKVESRRGVIRTRVSQAGPPVGKSWSCLIPSLFTRKLFICGAINAYISCQSALGCCLWAKRFTFYMHKCNLAWKPKAIIQRSSSYILALKELMHISILKCTYKLVWTR